jgi:hypothetical protein
MTKSQKTILFIGVLGILSLIGGVITSLSPKLEEKKERTQEQKIERELTRIVSPVGIARFIRIDNLDKKFRSEGEYTLSLELPNTDETKKYLEQIGRAIEEFKLSEQKRLGRELRSAKLPWRIIQVDNSQGNAQRTTEGGINKDEIYLIKYRELGSFRHKGKRIDTKIHTFDQQGKELQLKITPNSKVKVSADVILFNNVYGVGASLRLKAVQLIELSKEAPSLIPEEFGFVSESWGQNEPLPKEAEPTEPTEPTEPAEPAETPRNFQESKLESDTNDRAEIE